MKSLIYLTLISCLSYQAYADIIDKFPFTCLCNKTNSFEYFDCKNKIGGAILELDETKKKIYNSTDEKYYKISKSENILTAFYDADNYESSIILKNEVYDMIFRIYYPKYEKEWSYKLKCVSVKQY